MPAAQTATALEILTFRGGFNTNIVIAGTTLLGLAAGITGVFMLLRKRSLTSDALAHATLPGIAGAFILASLLGYEPRSLPLLLTGAAITAALSVIAIHAILRHSRLHEDTAIGVVLSASFALGIVGLSYIQANTPSGSGGLKAFIFGQAAAMNPNDVALMAAVAGAVLVATALFFKELALICFNDAFAKVDGWPVSLIDLLMMSLVVLVTVGGLQAVGLILVIAMLIIPPVAARFWTERLWKLVLIAAVIGAACGYFGSAISALFPRKPAGAVIVLTAGAIFTISLLFAPSRGVLASAFRRLRLKLSIAGDHLLERAHNTHASSLSQTAIHELASVRGWSFLFRPLVLTALARAGMIQCNRSDITITHAGALRGSRVARNHALWEQYLVSYADIAPSHVDWSVDQVEHILSAELIQELEQSLAQRNIHIPAQPPPVA